MGCCSGRCMLVLLCCVQLITAVERQVFDFLGYQWAPIMVNFFHIIVVILGLFGAIQYQSRYVTMYLLWMFVWIGWNVFVICLYLDLGGLSKDSHVLSLGVSSHSSWWKSNGPGCRSQNQASDRWSEHQNPRLTMVSSCWLQYQYLEVLHCAAQLLLSIINDCKEHLFKDAEKNPGRRGPLRPNHHLHHLKFGCETFDQGRDLKCVQDIIFQFKNQIGS